MEKIIKINRLIAEFMGYEVIPYFDSKQMVYNGNKFAKTIGEQKAIWNGLDMQFTGRFVTAVTYPFDTDFNYLIPVIRKIEEQGYVVAIKGISYQIYKVLEENNPIVSLVCGDLSKKTEMTCDLIVQFIEELNLINHIKNPHNKKTAKIWMRVGVSAHVEVPENATDQDIVDAAEKLVGEMDPGKLYFNFDGETVVYNDDSEEIGDFDYPRPTVIN